MVAGLLAAYVSTISTHLNWGTSYLVHDFYRRFLRPDADERHYVLVGRLVTAVLMVLAARPDAACSTSARDELRPAAVDRRRHRACSTCCAGSGGGSTRGARSRRWSARSSWRWRCSSPSGGGLVDPRAPVADRDRRDHDRGVARGHVADGADRSRRRCGASTSWRGRRARGGRPSAASAATWRPSTTCGPASSAGSPAACSSTARCSAPATC